MGDSSPRSVLLGGLRLARSWPTEKIAALCSGERFAPQPLSDTEHAALDALSLRMPLRPWRATILNGSTARLPRLSVNAV